MPDEYVIVLTTWPSDGDAEDFARTLVTERLAACVNLLAPMTSIYRWEGQVEEGRERQVLIKTRRSQITALRERLHTLHPYEVPEFLVLPIDDGSEAYLAWISDSLDRRTQGPTDLGT